MARRTVILVPPSEGKADGGSGPPWQPGTMAIAELDDARAQVLAALGTGHPAAAAPTCPASERYTGVLYRELDLASLPAAHRRRLARDLLTVSGLWGLVAPTDPIPDYRLKMSASAPGLGKLSTWWRPQLTEALAPRVHRALVWDLLPQEHAAAIDWRSLQPVERRTVRFVDPDGRTVSHWNKLLKGALVRWLASGAGADLDDLASFDHPQGYRYDPVATAIDGSHVAIELRRPG
jgi:cytoplasmic iron level regulating protein YaaA (DUF328/UPF0246 family)